MSSFDRAERKINPQWFVVKTKPGQENRAELNLDRQGFAVFHPKRATTTRGVRGWAEKVVTLFPGYIFVCFDPARPGWAPIRSTYGVQKLITVAGCPAALPGGFVEELRERCAVSDVIAEAEEFSAGQKVRISRGPFTQLIGEIERLGPKDRVRLLVELLNGKVSVEATKNDLVSLTG